MPTALQLELLPVAALHAIPPAYHCRFADQRLQSESAFDELQSALVIRLNCVVITLNCVVIRLDCVVIRLNCLAGQTALRLDSSAENDRLPR